MVYAHIAAVDELYPNEKVGREITLRKLIADIRPFLEEDLGDVSKEQVEKILISYEQSLLQGKVVAVDAVE
jgi:hypothetical protein